MNQKTITTAIMLASILATSIVAMALPLESAEAGRIVEVEMQEAVTVEMQEAVEVEMQKVKRK